MDIEQLLSSPLPPRRVDPEARQKLRRQLPAKREKLMVLDDDPTGTQTVHDVPVYLDWSPNSLTEALREESAVVYISTNSRALEAKDATELGRVLGQRLRTAEETTGMTARLASRSDSTLRGHFPDEVDALIEGYGRPVDGIILCPAFFEGGRCTANDIHYVLQGEQLIPAAETEFARDPVFGYTHSNLGEWVLEKTGRKQEVQSLSLELIRRVGASGISDLLLRAKHQQIIVVNALCYEDLEQVALGLMQAEGEGKRFVYRCAASIVKARGGFDDRPLLTRNDFEIVRGPGLIVVGSWVERTSQQLACLLNETAYVAIELDASAYLQGASENHEQKTAAAVTQALRAGKTAVLFTSRRPVAAKAEDFTALGQRVMSALCEVVRRLEVEPSFVVAKGGITSIEIARTALGAKRAEVLGQIAKGVPVWRLGAGARWAHLPYVVFPGNVGTETTLREVVEVFRT